VRKELRKELVTQLERQLKDSLPNFSRSKEGPLPSGSRLYSWKFSDEATLYLILIIPNRAMDDRFTVEFCWSRKHSFPYKLLPAISLEDPSKDEFCFRLPLLWHPSGPVEFWWQIAHPVEITSAGFQIEPIDKAQKNIPSFVSEVISRINNDALPFFKRVLGQ